MVAERPRYPFTAIVGQERLKRALLLHAVHPQLGGVLVRGEKGTAKSTAVRALAALMGDAPFVELPLGATEDRIVGSIDLEAAIQTGERRFEPGLLAAAHGGVLYVDEINLLPDHLVDLLLDAAAMGINYVEREGISASHPAVFVLAGTMNPEEGELRPQLLDRFALAADVEPLTDPALRAQVVLRRIAFERDPVAFSLAYASAEAAERERIQAARALLDKVQVPEPVVTLIAHLCLAVGVDGMRADIATYKAAQALAALDGRREVTAGDVRLVAELTLPHRRRRGPLDEPGLDPAALDDAIARFKPDQSHSVRSGAPPGQDGSGGRVATARPNEGESRATPATAAGERSAGGGAHPGLNGVTVAAQAPPALSAWPLRGILPRSWAAQTRAIVRPRATEDGARSECGSGRSSQPGTNGRVIGAKTPTGRLRSFAAGATLRAAAPHQPRRRAAIAGTSKLGLCIRPHDLREWRRRPSRRHTVVLVLDVSGSMASHAALSRAKGLTLALLRTAYQARARLGLVVFQHGTAREALPPTAGIAAFAAFVRDVPAGGRTPLAEALTLAGRVLTRPAFAAGPRSLWLLTDGRPNVAGGGPAAARSQALAAARCLATGRGAHAVHVIDAESGPVRFGFAATLAAALGGRYLHLDSLPFEPPVPVASGCHRTPGA